MVLIVRSTLTFHVKSMSEIVKYVKTNPYLLRPTTEQIGIHRGGGVACVVVSDSTTFD
ncbi:MAG TPA: hypothetical protein VH796_13405 [Nitrososphaeraceae archaeon]